MTECEEKLQEIIDMLNGPRGPADNGAYDTNVVDVVEEVIDKYWELYLTIDEVKTRLS